MAALISDARAARIEATRLRREANTHKVLLRANAAYSREQLRAAEAALDRVYGRRCEPLPSSWSSLRWIYDTRALDGVLVSIS